MRTIKAKKDKKLLDTFEVCHKAADYVYAYCSSYSDVVEIEPQDDTISIKDIISDIKEDLSDTNLYKNADDKVIRNIIKKYYMIVDLYHSYDYLRSANDHSYDNAVFNGAS